MILYPIPMCGFSPPTSQAITAIHWVSYKSVQLIIHIISLGERQIPQVKRSVLQDSPLPTSDTNHQVPSPRCHLCFWQPGYRSEVSMTSLLGLMNLLEQLAEHTETFYFLDYWFIPKGHRASMPSPRGPLCSNLYMFTNRKALWIHPFMEASLYKHHWFNH